LDIDGTEEAMDEKSAKKEKIPRQPMPEQKPEKEKL
jgi:hypothetical protein